jgi:hypothetical protein
MRLAVDHGNPSLALQFYREYEVWMARELEMAPGPQPTSMALELQDGLPRSATTARHWASSRRSAAGAATPYCPVPEPTRGGPGRRSPAGLTDGESRRFSRYRQGGDGEGAERSITRSSAPPVG